MLQVLAEKHPQAVAALTLQYRMNKDICQLSSILAYNGTLTCANDDVAHNILQLPRYQDSLSSKRDVRLQPWLYKCINPIYAVTFLDTDQLKNDPMNVESQTEFQALEQRSNRRAGGSIINGTEVRIVQMVVGGLLSFGLDHGRIGVISPFRSQVRALEECEFLKQGIRYGLEISTIDRYQGRDKDVMILSLVRSNKKGTVGKLLNDFRRLNVAISRAKYKLIMIGSYTTLSTGSPTVFKPVLEMIQTNQRILRLPSDGVTLE
jgi:DNA replication ATP-dependent helicase Dna2